MAWYHWNPVGATFKARDYYARAKEEEAAQKVAEARERQRRSDFRQNARNNLGGDPIPSIGYHPNVKRMRIQSEDGGDPLICHYDPTEFTEKYTAEWEKVPITGGAISPIAFKFVRPREWSMKLLFNDLGEDLSKRTTGVRSTESALFMLRGWFLPEGVVASSSAHGDRPPVLNVIIVNELYRCCLTDMSVVYKAVHPTSRVPTRAEVNVTFTEFTPGNIPL